MPHAFGEMSFAAFAFFYRIFWPSTLPGSGHICSEVAWKRRGRPPKKSIPCLTNGAELERWPLSSPPELLFRVLFPWAGALFATDSR